MAPLAGFLELFRWAFLPLGLLALIAVGVHAAADTVDDRILWLVDQVDAGVDSVMGSWSLTEGWVNVIGLEQRVTFARALTLALELFADVVLALPALGYREARQRPLLPRLEPWYEVARERVRKQWDRFRARPTTLVLFRPISTAAVCLAGSCAVARMVQGAVYFSSREWLGDALAGAGGRLLALGALAGVLAALGWRAVLRNFEHAQQVSSQAPNLVASLRQGLVGSMLILPLAVAALMDASPVFSFLR